MTNKTQIAADYIALHKDSNINNWSGYYESVGCYTSSRSEKLEAIYDNLINDVYGETREIAPGKYEIEICSNDSKTGAPILFEFSPEGIKQ
jgi:hypothetical protein